MNVNGLIEHAALFHQKNIKDSNSVQARCGLIDPLLIVFTSVNDGYNCMKDNKEENNRRNDVVKEVNLLEEYITRSPSVNLETFKLCQTPLTFYANSAKLRPYGISSAKLKCDEAYLIVSREESGYKKGSENK
ncbi:hypothetical protein O9G_004617 [Rozella allomycis CSF55]|uniref:Uncharacterized protein n=1 Tax=Rozella allomycis (strain CSF55) TaxID=988480 RepID=A0A075AW52_ROZAC|nr:hypothetical protein O9G_004617 [Rozella allomycis CSF55]|eukprot:EPZ32937.1 hypothetical protein O9G_004617 [Rozella allomycis CSF55]